MAEECSSVDIATSIENEAWTVPMFQRAFALYHDQVCLISQGKVLAIESNWHNYYKHT